MEKKRYLYVLRLVDRYQKEDNWNDETNQIVSSHFDYLKRLTEARQVILAGRTDTSVENPDGFGIAVFEATDDEEAERIMQNDPAVKQGVMKAILYPFSLPLLRESS